jgi:cytoskeleton protein RodZ
VTAAAFGERLRRARERRGISLQTISQSTKIRASLYGALEAGHCSGWPCGVYIRSHVRDYATMLGLDPDQTVAEFCEAFPDTAWPEGPPAPIAQQPPATPESRSGHLLSAWRRAFSLD